MTGTIVKQLNRLTNGSIHNMYLTLLKEPA
jgi:hypothetical protein